MTALQSDQSDTDKRANHRRRFIIRYGLCAGWVGLAAILFFSYRGHTLLVDNRAVDDLRPQGPLIISLNNGAKLEFLPGDLDRFTIVGCSHRILIEFDNGAPPIERRFTVHLAHDYGILSIPKLLANREPFVEPFTPEREDAANQAAREEE